ncbi:uncharacterized protein [Rutidosis leptorrhynchoides]|uniref:uncharacterized protein n=1 Tax=Rutidosis leptorrhynchoides TaxID=125765 RepID=UPI003A99C5BF
MSSSSSPCAACKFLRRKCTQECVFAPYFPPDQPQKFANVHKVFGASNVAKILNELSAAQREDAVNSLAYEAEARLRDPVYGCVGFISILQHKLKQIQTDLHNAKQELSTYMGPSALVPVLNPGLLMQQYPNLGPVMANNNMQPMLGIQGQVGTSSQHQQQLYEAQQQQLVEAAREHEMLRNLEQQQQLHHQQHQQQSIDLMRFNRGFNGAGPSGQVNPSGFTHLTGPAAAMAPSLALGGAYDNNVYQIQNQQHPQQEQQLLQQQHQLQHDIPHELFLQQQTPSPQLLPHQQQQTQQPQHGDVSEEGRSVGPSS